MEEIYKFKQSNGILTISEETIEKMIALQDKYSDEKFEVKPLLSRVYGKFSRDYFAPTFVKGYNRCPASCFLSYLQKKEESPILNLGTAVHSVYEQAVNKHMINPEEIKELSEKIFVEYNLQPNQRKDFNDWVEAFTHRRMYDNSLLMDGSKEHFTEIYVSEKNLEVFNIPLGYVSCLIDRMDLDVVNKEINIVDYKTGKIIRGIDYAIQTYRDQMITYAWACKANFPGYKVSTYLYSPAIDQYIKIDTTDLVNQSKWIEEILDFKENKSNTFLANHTLEQRPNEYCKYCSLKGNCSACDTEFNKNFGKVIDKSLLEPLKEGDKNDGNK